MTAKDEFVSTGRGIINDIEANLLKLVQISFERNETLRFYSSYRPLAWIAANPSRIENFESLPAVYAWCDGLNTVSESAGGALGKPLNQKVNFFCEVEYILPPVGDIEAETTLKEVAWELFTELTQNLNLFGMFSGPSEILEMNTYPDMKMFDDKLRPVSTVNFKMRLFYQRKIRHATL
jgi:hypothetical protein